MHSSRVKSRRFAGLAIQSGQAGEHVLDLHAIGADVLHRCRADGAGNQAEVFQPRQPLRQGVLHERMPRLAGLGFDHDLAAVIAQDANPARGHAQHQRLDIGRQQQIAATANHQQRHVMFHRIGQGFTHVGIAMGLGKQPGLNVDAKAVERFERNLGVAPANS